MSVSYRAGVACTWVSHRVELGLVPAALVGALVMGGIAVPHVLLVVAGPLTVALIMVAAVGSTLHRELDRAGVPCPSCPTRHEGADDARS